MDLQLGKSPMVGRNFEHLVKSVKRCLRKIVGQAKFSYDELNTVLVEVKLSSTYLCQQR